MMEFTKEQEQALLRFLHDNTGFILSNESVRYLEPLLKIIGSPKDFWVAREKLKEIKALTEKELFDYVPWYPRGDFSHQLLQIHPKLDNPINNVVHYRLEAKKTETGFSATVAAYLDADLVPGATDALGVKLYANGPGDRLTPIDYFMEEEDVNKLDPKRVIDAIRAYSVLVSSLRQPKEVTVK